MKRATVAELGPEGFAAHKIAAALNLFLDPDVGAIAEDSGLSVAEVEAMVDRLHAGRMRAVTGKATPTPAATPAPPAGAWRAGLDHPSKRIRALATRAEKAVTAVEAALAADAPKAALRRREADLRAQLQHVRAEMAGMS